MLRQQNNKTVLLILDKRSVRNSTIFFNSSRVSKLGSSITNMKPHVSPCSTIDTNLDVVYTPLN